MAQKEKKSKAVLRSERNAKKHGHTTSPRIHVHKTAVRAVTSRTVDVVSIATKKDLDQFMPVTKHEKTLSIADNKDLFKHFMNVESNNA